jgi:hypothetical protein
MLPLFSFLVNVFKIGSTVIFSKIRNIRIHWKIFLILTMVKMIRTTRNSIFLSRRLFICIWCLLILKRKIDVLGAIDVLLRNAYFRTSIIIYKSKIEFFYMRVILCWPSKEPPVLVICVGMGHSPQGYPHPHLSGIQ